MSEYLGPPSGGTTFEIEGRIGAPWDPHRTEIIWTGNQGEIAEQLEYIEPSTGLRFYGHEIPIHSFYKHTGRKILASTDAEYLEELIKEPSLETVDWASLRSPETTLYAHHILDLIDGNLFRCTIRKREQVIQSYPFQRGFGSSSFFDDVSVTLATAFLLNYPARSNDYTFLGMDVYRLWQQDVIQEGVFPLLENLR